MGLSKEELIKKLEAISILHDRALSIKRKMNNFEPDDNYERKVKVLEFPLEIKNEYDEGVLDIIENEIDHTPDDAVEYMARCYDKAYQPEQPAEPKLAKQPAKDTSRTDEYTKKMGCMPIVAGFVVICSLISGGLFSGETLTIVLNLIIIVACVIVALSFFKKKKELVKEDEEATKIAIKEYEQTKIELQEKHKKDMEAYQNDINSYKLRKADFLEEYAKWREVYLESLKEEEEIEEQLEKDRQAAVEKINNEEFMPVLNDLVELNDLVTEEYLPALDVIIDLLRSGRADDLKEAINLYEDIVYRERQLQLEREKEAQRQREEAMRREAEERHHAAQMAMQKEQLAMQEEQARKQLQLQEQQHRDAMKMQADRLKQEEAAAKASRQKRCVWCAHKSTCRQQYYEGAYNCTGFTPK